MRNLCARLLVCAVAGCASQGSEAAVRQADTAAQRDSIAAVAASTMSEAQVVGLLEQTHAADSALGALGALKGSTEVKDFGRMILREHHALRRDAIALAQALGTTPAAPQVAPDAPAAELQKHLETASPGTIWDQAYLEYAMVMHESAMENSARALAATRNPATKEFIQKSVPILQKHLDKASSLRKALDTSSDGAAAKKP